VEVARLAPLARQRELPRQRAQRPNDFGLAAAVACNAPQVLDKPLKGVPGGLHSILLLPQKQQLS
jgi:hypothetical protein